MCIQTLPSFPSTSSSSRNTICIPKNTQNCDAQNSNSWYLQHIIFRLRLTHVVYIDVQQQVSIHNHNPTYIVAVNVERVLVQFSFQISNHLKEWKKIHATATLLHAYVSKNSYDNIVHTTQHFRLNKVNLLLFLFHLFNNTLFFLSHFHWWIKLHCRKLSWNGKFSEINQVNEQIGIGVKYTSIRISSYL